MKKTILAVACLLEITTGSLIIGAERVLPHLIPPDQGFQSKIVIRNRSANQVQLAVVKPQLEGGIISLEGHEVKIFDTTQAPFQDAPYVSLGEADPLVSVSVAYGTASLGDLTSVVATDQPGTYFRYPTFRMDQEWMGLSVVDHSYPPQEMSTLNIRQVDVVGRVLFETQHQIVSMEKFLLLLSELPLVPLDHSFLEILTDRPVHMLALAGNLGDTVQYLRQVQPVDVSFSHGNLWFNDAQFNPPVGEISIQPFELTIESVDLNPENRSGDPTTLRRFALNEMQQAQFLAIYEQHGAFDLVVNPSTSSQPQGCGLAKLRIVERERANEIVYDACVDDEDGNAKAKLLIRDIFNLAMEIAATEISSD